MLAWFPATASKPADFWAELEKNDPETKKFAGNFAAAGNLKCPGSLA